MECTLFLLSFSYTMLESILFCAFAAGGQHPASHSAQFGWHDELNRQYEWTHLATSNKPDLDWSKPGLLGMTLHHVPRGWPYQYQWSGVTKTVEINVAENPILSARVSELKGYAHLDIDVLDGHNKILLQLRSNTLQSPGICSVKLSERIFPGTYSFRIRLIVGGPNEGCSATYDWIRGSSEKDAKQFGSDLHG